MLFPPSAATVGRSCPAIHPTAFIAPTAAVMGDVTLGEDASVWYGAVLRGDMAPIVIGAETNLQDGTIVHVDEGVPCIVGRAGRRGAPGDPARLHRRGRVPDRDGQHRCSTACGSGRAAWSRPGR